MTDRTEHNQKMQSIMFDCYVDEKKKIDSVKGLDIDFVKGLHLSHKYERLAIKSVK